ncbi:MAG: putative tRNA sulfurtransferase [Mycoplasmataceae bacterium]|nr:MAG: putative tRNA sulfurtransferase [Mycoplasmataceae bacterium]
MKKYLIIRFGELFLKKRNRETFVNKLVNNLKISFEKNNLKSVWLEKSFDQLFINVNDLTEIENNVIEDLLKNTFGISNYYRGYLSSKDIYKDIEYFFDNLNNFLEINFTSFRVSFKRNDKSFPMDSQSLERKFGGLIAKKYNLKVSLIDYQKNIEVSIYKNFAIFLINKIKCVGGLPVGTSGKALLLFSGGLDSSVAAYNLMKRGLEVVYLHFYVDEETDKDKIFKLVKKLEKHNNYNNEIHLINTKKMLKEISHIEIEDYRIIILKRMFLRFAERLANLKNISVIANGDSIGQVASQTISSLDVIYESIDSKLIISPLITKDKQEIIDEAKNIDVYDLAIIKYEDCCSIFQPKNPVTNPKKSVAKYLEEKIIWSEIINNTNIELILI